MAIPAEQCAGLLRDALSNRPSDPWSDEASAWFAHVAGIVSAHSTLRGATLQVLLPRATNVHSAASNPLIANMTLDAQAEFVARARTLLTELQLATNTFATAQVGAGAVHDYFEEVRQIIARATADVLFIDPYIDASFVTRYFPQIPSATSIRLLTAERQAPGLSQALDLYTQQHGRSAQLRVVPDRSIHDRHLVIDRAEVFQSGASFKDGGRNAPTSINQIVDVAADLARAHESSWAGARVVR